MSEIGQLLSASAERLITSGLTTQAIEAARQGAWLADLWDEIEEAGFPLALVPEASGGFGTDVGDAMELVRIAARHALPLPLPETLVANYVLSCGGLQLPGGPLSFAPALSRVTLRKSDGGWHFTGRADRIPWGRHCGVVAIATTDEGRAACVLAPGGSARVVEGANLAGEPRDGLEWDVDLDDDAVAELPGARALWSLDALGALIRAVQIGGAVERVLELTVEYTLSRKQFGKPIAGFQVIQHELAIAAGQVAAAMACARMAELHFEQQLEQARPLAVAAIKGRSSEAASRVSAIAHQVHGAIGLTREHSLHVFTNRLLSWRDEFGTEAEWYRAAGAGIVAAGGLWSAVTAE